MDKKDHLKQIHEAYLKGDKIKLTKLADQYGAHEFVSDFTSYMFMQNIMKADFVAECTRIALEVATMYIKSKFPPKSQQQ